MEMIPLASNGIQWIKAEFLRCREDKARKKLADKMPIVDIEALEFSAIELGTEASITSSFPTLYLSFNPIPSAEA